MSTPISTLAGVRQILAGAIPSSPPHNFAYLATVDSSGVARCRTMTLRGYDAADDTLWTTSHLAARKVQDLRINSQAEVCLWIGESGVQLRLVCRWEIVDAPRAAESAKLTSLRQHLWDAQPPTIRATHGVPPDSPEIPPTFGVLLGHVTTVDALHITPSVSHKYVHTRQHEGWESKALVK